MRVLGLHIIVPVLAAVAVAAIARAQPDAAPATVDPAGEDQPYGIKPGVEALFAEMLGRGQTLPAGCMFNNGKIERFSVLATYDCGDAPVVLQLVHPEVAPADGVRTQRFAMTVKSGTPPAGFVEAIAERVRAGEAGFEWTELGSREKPRRSPVPVAVGAVAAVVAFWALRRWRRGATAKPSGPITH